MSPVITFWVHSGLEHPLTGTCYDVAFTGGPCWHVHPICWSASALTPFLPAFCLVWRHKRSSCPGSVSHPVPWEKLRIWTNLGHLQWHGRLKQLLQNHQEKWDMGIPGFFCHKRHENSMDSCCWREPRKVNEMHFRAQKSRVRASVGKKSLRARYYCWILRAVWRYFLIVFDNIWYFLPSQKLSGLQAPSTESCSQQGH